MDELFELKQDLVEVFKKHGIDVYKGSIRVEARPFYQNEDFCMVRPISIEFDQLLVVGKPIVGVEYRRDYHDIGYRRDDYRE